MLRAAVNYFKDIPGVFIDGVLYCSIGFLAYSQTYFGGDEAAKWLDPQIKFYLNYFFGGSAIIASHLKSYRSSQFAEHQAAKKANGSGNTQFLTRSETSTTQTKP